MKEIIGKHANLSIERPELLRQICHALSSQTRIDILRMLGEGNKSVGELAKALDIPMSTAALSVRILEDANLILSEVQPGTHGSLKICSRKLDSLAVSLVHEQYSDAASLVLRMPIGGYSTADAITPTCGLASEFSVIGPMDSPNLFYTPERFAAQLIWFQKGFLEYRFAPPEALSEDNVEWIEISFEACSEAPMYRDPWKSDIAVEVNDVRLGVWTSPCDCGGRRGRLTPEWWSILSTQYGFLKTWRVDRSGTYLDSERISDITVRDLSLTDCGCVSVRIGIPDDAEHIGGMNLFGEKFGDHSQSLELRICYTT
ncbi:MAG: helix-turn-helix domain-containing protein [Clostridia bacterium]|nr:helix-turn-helix domain-containing protein [Clostridia bacterium]